MSSSGGNGGLAGQQKVEEYVNTATPFHVCY